MSFDLRIRFIGLAIFVPEDARAMHVLLPATRAHAHPPAEGAGHSQHGSMEPHFTRILYDTAYERPGQPQLSREYKLLDIDGRVLDLTGLPASGTVDLGLPSELPPLDHVAEPVERALVTKLADERLAGRVTIDAGALTDYTLGARFRLGNGEVERMTVATEWTVRGIRSRLSASEGGNLYLPGLILRGPSPDQETRLPNLFPIGQTIHLTVFNAVGKVFPPHGAAFDIAKPQDRADHFTAYYTVCRKRPEIGDEDSIPQAATEKQVSVEGDLVRGQGPETPSMTCVQAKASLATA